MARISIDRLMQFSLENEHKGKLTWIPCSDIDDIKSSQIDNVHYAVRKQTLLGGTFKKVGIILLSLGNDETCTPTFVSEFARIYSLPTHEHVKDVSQFRRYSEWLASRNKLICGFTKHDDKYYMVADGKFYHCYSRYGFCAACGLLRCSPLWCVCGHKQLSVGWTSNNKRLDEFIKKSQLQTTSANHAYLEWIPSDCIEEKGCDLFFLCCLPTSNYVKLIPLEITNETDESYYDRVSDSILICITFVELSGNY